MPPARARRVWIRFSEQEHGALITKAQAAGCSVSALVRDHLGKVRVRHREDERRRIAILNRINANLNMLAKWTNTHKSAADTVQVTAYLAAVEQEIARLVAAHERR